MGWLDRPAARLGLLALVLALMLRASWNAPLLDFDDAAHVRLATRKPWTHWFAPSDNSTYFPITLFSYWVDERIFGPAIPAQDIKQNAHPIANSAPTESVNRGVIGLRCMNGFYHLLAGFILWEFLRRLGSTAGMAAFVALAWTAHPMACESVCWIAERKNVLCALFGFGSLLAWTSPRHAVWRWPLVYLLYLLAVTSKPSALGILPVLAALELIDPIRREFSMRRARDWVAVLERLSPLVFISLVDVLANVHGHQFEIIEPPGGSMLTALMTDTEIFCRYAQNVLLPTRLSFFYGVEAVSSALDVRFWLYGLILALIFWLLISAADRASRPLSVLGALWFFGALAPSANLIAIPFWLQDRYAYLSSAGLLLVFALSGSGLIGRIGAAGASRYKVLFGCGYLLLIMVLMCQRSALFRDADSLVLDAVERQPLSAMARLSAASVYRTRYLNSLPDGARPDPEAAEASASLALEQYARAAACKDIYSFTDPFTLRILQAEFLLTLQRAAQARELLYEWPPANMTPMREFDGDGRAIPRARKDFAKAYPMAALARARQIAATVCLSQCTPELTTDEKLKLCGEALSDADESIKLALNIREMRQRGRARDEEIEIMQQMIDEGRLLKGRVLFELNILSRESNHVDDAHKYAEAAVAELKLVPEISPSARLAHRIILELENESKR